ncbi:hypothetical protein AB7W88_02655 [Providencia vermicola]
MVNENISLLSCAVSLETRAQSFFRSPFVLSEDDRLVLKDKDLLAQLTKSVKSYNVPVFIVDYMPGRKLTEVDNFVRHDSYILRLALLVYSIRVKILNGTLAESFYWLGSDEALNFIERLDDSQTIDAIIKGELYIKPVRSLRELASGAWSSVFGSDNPHMTLPAYLQLRFEHWSTDL